MPSLSWDEAVEQVCGEGGPFAHHEEIIRGVPTKVVDTAPPLLRNLFDLARMRGDQLYIVYEDEHYTFAETMERVDAVGSMLVNRYGIQKGDRVAIAMRNYPEWIFSFVAITSIGAVAVPLNAWWTAEELEFGFADSGSKVLIADQERIDRIAPALGRLDLKRGGRPPRPRRRGRRPVRRRPAARRSAARGRRRHRRRRHHPLHLGHDRQPKGAVSTQPGHRARHAGLRLPCRHRPARAGDEPPAKGEGPSTRRARSSPCPCSTSPAASR
jgi:hypothetical protein